MDWNVETITWTSFIVLEILEHLSSVILVDASARLKIYAYPQLIKPELLEYLSVNSTHKKSKVL